MKKLFITIFLLSYTFCSQATSWRVNNTTGINADFTTAQAAHDSDSVMSGDTIYFEASPNTYGDLKLYKQLVLIGSGYFLNENYGTQATKYNAMLGTVSFEEDPGISSSSAGSQMISLQCTWLYFYTSDVTILRSRITGYTYMYTNYTLSGPKSGTSYTSSVSNITISQCYFDTYSLNIYSASNVIITNCKLNAVSNTSTSTGIIISNCIFNGHNLDVYNASVSNCIFTGNQIYPENSSYSYNIGTSVIDLPEGDNNDNTFTVAELFDSNYTGGADAYYVLLADSPATGAGYDGVDCGIYGGASPYVLSGLPPIPIIYSFSAPAVGNTSNGLQITVKIRSNN